MLEREEDVNPDKYALEEPLIFKASIFNNLKDKNMLMQINQLKAEYLEEISKICNMPKEDFADETQIYVVAQDINNRVIGFISVGFGHPTKECFRLMGVKDEQFDRLNGISNSQLYKLAGNSIVVDVLEAIFKNLLMPETTETKGQLSLF